MTGYAPHQAYVDPARGSAEVVQTAAGFFAIEFLYGVVRDISDAVLFRLVPGSEAAVTSGVAKAATYYDLFSFGLLAAIVVFIVRFYHQRSPLSLIGPFGLALYDFRRALVGGLLLFLTLQIVFPWWSVSDAEAVNPLGWALALPLALVALFIQCAAEEMFYRGYLQQQVGARFSSPWVWLIVPNIAFAAVHWFNGIDRLDSLKYVLWAFVFGLAASDLVARSGSLGAATGFHMANNIFAFLVVGDEGMPGSGLALFLYPVDPGPLSDPWAEDGLFSLPLVVDLGVILLLWLAVRVAIRR